MINSMFILFNILTLGLIILIGVLAVRFIGGRISKKLSVRLMGLYTVVLLVSPIMAGFIGESADTQEDPIKVPHYYLEGLLEDYENQSFEDLQQDEFIYQSNETEFSVAVDDFSEDSPFTISSYPYGQIYGNPIIIEITDEVDSIVITQFQQRFFMDGYEISKELNPWNWTLANQQLRAEIPRTEIDFHSLSPTGLAFHFDESLSDTFQQRFDFGYIPSESSIQWIQLPENLEFQYRGDGPWRIIK